MTESEVIQNRADTIESEVTIDVRYQKFHEVTLDRERESRTVKGYFYFGEIPPTGAAFLRNKPGTPCTGSAVERRNTQGLFARQTGTPPLNPARKRDRRE